MSLIASEQQGMIWEIVIDTVIVFFMTYIILNVIKCLIVTSNISVNYVHIFKVE